MARPAGLPVIIPFHGAPSGVCCQHGRATGEALAQAYDLVINGHEMGGGSIRIHQRDIQERMFRVLGMPEEEQREKFGFLLDAFRFGPPPHGGLALGVDRLVMEMVGAPRARCDRLSEDEPSTGFDARCSRTYRPRAVQELYLESTVEAKDSLGFLERFELNFRCDLEQLSSHFTFKQNSHSMIAALVQINPFLHGRSSADIHKDSIR